MRQLLLAFAAVLSLALPGRADEAVNLPAGAYALDPSHASITFKVKHMGLSFYTARFTKIEAKLDFDPKKPENAKLDVKVDPASIRTDFPFPEKENFDKKLAEDAQWFNVKVHPAITFTSTKVEPTGANTAKVTGDLTFLGQTKPVTLDAVLNGAMATHPMTKTPAVGFSATTSVKRSDFGWTDFAPMIGDDVKVMIEAEFLGS